jgi:hypothetical protein
MLKGKNSEEVRGLTSEEDVDPGRFFCVSRPELDFLGIPTFVYISLPSPSPIINCISLHDAQKHYKSPLHRPNMHEL